MKPARTKSRRPFGAIFRRPLPLLLLLDPARGTPAIRGERFAVLPFLHDEAGAKVREENLKYLDPALTG